MFPLVSVIEIGAKLIDKLIPDEQARAQAKLELLKAENQQALSELQIQMSAIIAEAQSADPWTSRARPSFLYIVYLIMLLCVAAAVAGIWWPAHVSLFADNLHQLFAAIPDMIWEVFIFGYLGYTGARTWEKGKGVSK